MTTKAQKVLEKMRKRRPKPLQKDTPKDPRVQDDGPVAGAAQELGLLFSLFGSILAAQARWHPQPLSRSPGPCSSASVVAPTSTTPWLEAP